MQVSEPLAVFTQPPVHDVGVVALLESDGGNEGASLATLTKLEPGTVTPRAWGPCGGPRSPWCACFALHAPKIPEGAVTTLGSQSLLVSAQRAII